MVQYITSVKQNYSTKDITAIIARTPFMSPIYSSFLSQLLGPATYRKVSLILLWIILQTLVLQNRIMGSIKSSKRRTGC